MDQLQGGWPDRVLTMQRNWIGRSEGAHVDFAIEGGPADGRVVTVFTTRPDTLYGATFFVVAPDAALAAEIVTDEQRPAFEAYLATTQQATEIERQATDRPKTGVPLGVHAVNPANGERLPVCAADYVLAEYGTGAVMAVPGARRTATWSSPAATACRSAGSSTPASPTRPRPAWRPRVTAPTSAPASWTG